jgi:hypothetical protein
MPHSDWRKIRLEPNLPERNYCVIRGVCVDTEESRTVLLRAGSTSSVFGKIIFMDLNEIGFHDEKQSDSELYTVAGLCEYCNELVELFETRGIFVNGVCN